MRIRVHIIALAFVVLCSTFAVAARGPLRVLVTNDDGVKAPGIDALVRELATNPNLALTVIAPATNQSGTGDQFTTTSITVTPSSTAGAFPATAVGGFPADTVLYGVLQAMPERPDLVVSGINFGQNIGELVTLSGTIGAGLTAARLGIPAIAVSQGIGATLSYDAAAHYVGQLVERFRKSRGMRAKLTTRFGLRHALVVNVNFPTCSSGSLRGVQRGTARPRDPGDRLCLHRRDGIDTDVQAEHPARQHPRQRLPVDRRQPADRRPGDGERVRERHAAQRRPDDVGESQGLPLPRAPLTRPRRRDDAGIRPVSRQSGWVTHQMLGTSSVSR